MVEKQSQVVVSRRRFMTAAGAGLVFPAFFSSAQATPDDLATAKRELFGDRRINDGRVSLDVPAISENGYSVPITVEVESPMTEDDYVSRIVILSEQNPIANISQYTLGPRAGRAMVSSRVRLSGTQTLLAVAELNDGSLWSGSAHTVVTLAACVIL